MSEPDEAPDAPRPERGAGLALLGETLLVGVVVGVASIPVVTAVPAVAAGVRHLRRHLVGSPDGIGALLAELWPALRDLWWLGAGLPAALLLLGFNLTASAAIPGGTAVAAVTVLLAVAVTVVVLRGVATWSPGTPATLLVRSSARRSAADLPGSTLVVVALLTCGVLVWMLVPMLLLVGGLVAMALLAVENRWATRT